MLKHEALEFVEKEIFDCWVKWKPSHPVREMWADAFKPYTYAGALAGFQRYYSHAETKFKPSIKEVMSYMGSSQSKIKDFVWIQNTKNGTFHKHYILGDKEIALRRLFHGEGAPFGDGSWRMYEQNETTHDELFKYRTRKDKGLKSAIEHIDSEANAINIIETYMVDPRSKPAKLIKEAVKALKDKKNNGNFKELKKEMLGDQVDKAFCEKYDLPQESVHQAEHVIEDSPIF